MSGKLVSLFIVIVLVSTINAMISVSVISELLQEYSDGSPMSEYIIASFYKSYYCQEKCLKWSADELRTNFEEYRKDWTDDMVEFVIKELGISEAGAKVVRENPEHFMIDFELFNLLKFK